MVKVTIAIPFSGEPPHYLRRAVQSVFCQSRDDWRLILVGDNARSDLVSLVRSIRDSRVTLMGSTTRKGLAFRLNESVRSTSTDYYMRLDADDVMLRDRLDRQLSTLEADPSIDVIGGRAILIDEEERPEGILREAPGVPEHVHEFLGANVLTHPSVVGRTQWFASHPYDVSIGRAEDKELWLRTARTSKIAKLNEPVIFYRLPQAFNRRKSVSTSVDDARVSLLGRKYGISRSHVARAVVASWVKAGIYQTVPKQSWPALRSRRVEPATDELLKGWTRDLAEIEQTKVRGWN